MYREFLVEGYLAHFLKCFWEFQTGEQLARHTILPDGYFDLIAIQDQAQAVRVELTGLWTKPVEVAIAPHTRLFGLRFKLLAAEYLFREPIADILDNEKELPPDFWQLDQLPRHGAAGLADLLTQQLGRVLANGPAVDERKLKLADLLYQSPRPAKVSEISELVCWQSRQINRYFAKQFGLPLKTFLKILHCQAAYPDLAQGELNVLTHHFDQAHFIKDIRRFTGVSPRQLYQNENDRFLQLSTLKQP
jgi:AraC-like DNA-binding protein